MNCSLCGCTLKDGNFKVINGEFLCLQEMVGASRALVPTGSVESVDRFGERPGPLLNNREAVSSGGKPGEAEPTAPASNQKGGTNEAEAGK